MSCAFRKLHPGRKERNRLIFEMKSGVYERETVTISRVVLGAIQDIASEVEESPFF